MSEDVIKAAEKVAAAVIKSPPEYYNGQQCFKIPSNIFKELEDAVRLYKYSSLDENNETDDEEPQGNNNSFPVSFV